MVPRPNFVGLLWLYTTACSLGPSCQADAEISRTHQRDARTHALFSGAHPCRSIDVLSRGGSSSTDKPLVEDTVDGQCRNRETNRTAASSCIAEEVTVETETTTATSDVESASSEESTVALASTTTKVRETDASGHGAEDATSVSTILPPSEEDPITTSHPSQEEIREKAAILRGQGKELHDDGEFGHASMIFHHASKTLEPIMINRSLFRDNQEDDDEETYNEVVHEYTTCLLHEALCRLKNNEYKQCIAACTKLLQDGRDGSDNDNASIRPHRAVVDIDAESDHEGDEHDDRSDECDTDTPGASETATVPSFFVPPLIRARAHHRRAKAKLELGNEKGALADARSAAFLGDSKGVALYGRLMRDSSTGSSPSSSDLFSQSDFASSLESMFGGPGTSSGLSRESSSGSLLESLIKKSQSTKPISDGGKEATAATSASPLASLLSGDLNPASILMSSLGRKSADGDASLAKSVIKNLSKKIDDDATQSTICRFLHSTNEQQLGQWSSMAGMELSDNQISRIVRVCHGITPKTIKRTVRTTKSAVYGVRLLRKVGRVLRKYRTLIFAVVLLQWCRSAIIRPIPINKRAAKRALKEAMRASRAGR